MMKKKIMLVQLIVVLGICVPSLLAAPTQNPTFSAPEIGAAVVCDGDLTDWVGGSSLESLPFVFWNGSGLSGTTTTARFAWSDALDMLYVAIETDEVSLQIGGLVVIGASLDANSSPADDANSTQLGFSVIDGGSDVNIINEIAEYGLDTTQGIVGIQAGQSVSMGVTTYEIAIPLWMDWSVMTTKQSLSVGSVVHVYVVMQDRFGSLNGSNMTYEGNPVFAYGAWGEGAEITLGTESPPPSCGDVLHPNPVGDFTDDCRVNFVDIAEFAGYWMNCTKPECD